MLCIEYNTAFISQVVEKLEEENSMLKENIKILEDSTAVSHRNFALSFLYVFAYPRWCLNYKNKIIQLNDRASELAIGWSLVRLLL